MCKGMCKGLGLGLGICYKCLRWLLPCKWFCKSRKHVHFEEPLKISRKRHKRIYKPTFINLSFTILFFLMTKLLIVDSCTKATTLTAKNRECQMEFNTIKKWTGFYDCVVQEVMRLSTAPEGQYSCLVIEAPDWMDKAPLLQLKIKTHKIRLNCLSENLYFSRSFKMNSESSKRCPTMGSCHGSKCKQYDEKSKFAEISAYANSMPGFSACTESCGCWGCQCGICSSGCLFYRYFAEQITPSIFEFFRCPIWTFDIRVSVQLVHPSGHIRAEKELLLQPGRSIVWEKMEFALIGATIPPLPILQSTFVTDGERIALVDAASSGQPVPDKVGALQCKSRKAAEDFDCYLPRGICTCHPQEDRAQCHCNAYRLEDIFEKEDQALPLQTQGVLLEGLGFSPDGSVDLIARLSNLAGLEIQVSQSCLTTKHHMFAQTSPTLSKAVIPANKEPNLITHVPAKGLDRINAQKPWQQ